jgi:hypothetical protein
MSFEDELRATLRAHDADAPTMTELPERPWESRRRRNWLPLAAAAAVIAIAVGVVAATQLPASTPPQPATLTSADCPAGDHPPQAPAPQGINAGDRLVPDETPEGVIVCAYLGSDGQLTGASTLHGDLSAVTESLTWLPRGDTHSYPCSTVLLPTDGENYLIGLSYADGALWVSAPGDHCAGATNANLRELADAAYRTQTWPGSEGTGKPCEPTDAGRLGQDETLVPGTPVGLRICARGEDRGANFDPAPLAAALNQLPTRPSTHICSQEGRHGQPYHLRFSYPTGPDVWVRVDESCRPAIDNNSLQADNPSTIMALLRDLGVAQ